MLGLMLARQGLDVIVLEKHKDFLHDFRGDDISPATIEVLGELGLDDDFLALGPKRIDIVEAHTPGGSILLADMRLVRTKFPFFAVLPQWDFLDFITAQAAREPHFKLLLSTEATGLIFDDDAVAGVRCQAADGEFEIRATLTVGADGRFSCVRDHAGLRVTETAAPIDVLWFRLPHTGSVPGAAMSVHLGGGQVMARVDRDKYWAVACVISKGSGEDVMRSDIADFRDTVARCMPDIADTVAGLRGWDQVSMLNVKTNRLRRWHRPGLICIGDAAHAMSPIGGAGINFAIGDAVALANRAAGPIKRGKVPSRVLAAVQRERAWQVRLMQSMQAPLTNAYIVLAADNARGLAAFAQRYGPRLANLPGFRGSRSRMTALGIRKSHVTELARGRAG
jgi:2-polyprenyl-6-methoxyphenol hydroxylase-like FAD-dependent oxidoreductase